MDRLLNAGADIGSRDNDGLSALHRAVLHGATDHAMFLLNRGADPWATRPWLLSCVGEKKLFRRLLSLRPPSPFIDDVLSRANGDCRDLRKLLTKGGVDAGARDEQGLALLHLLSTRKAAQAAIDLGADIEAIVPDHPGAYSPYVGWTPLGVQVQMPNSRNGGTLALIESGANVNFVHESRLSVLLLAVSNADRSPIKVCALLEAGADPTYSVEGANALHYACGWNRRDSYRTLAHDIQIAKAIVLALIEAKVSLEDRDADGRTPLAVAVGALDPDLSQVLLRAGADPNARLGDDRRTSLMIASEDAGLVEALLLAGADASIRCANDKTALDYAKEALERVDPPRQDDPSLDTENELRSWAEQAPDREGNRRRARVKRILRRQNIERSIGLLKSATR
jgi:ankyrin repeat protein